LEPQKSIDLTLNCDTSNVAKLARLRHTTLLCQDSFSKEKALTEPLLELALDTPKLEVHPLSLSMELDKFVEPSSKTDLFTTFPTGLPLILQFLLLLEIALNLFVPSESILDWSLTNLDLSIQTTSDENKTSPKILPKLSLGAMITSACHSLCSIPTLD